MVTWEFCVINNFPQHLVLIPFLREKLITEKECYVAHMSLLNHEYTLNVNNHEHNKINFLQQPI